MSNSRAKAETGIAPLPAPYAHIKYDVNILSSDASARALAVGKVASHINSAHADMFTDRNQTAFCAFAIQSRSRAHCKQSTVERQSNPEIRRSLGFLATALPARPAQLQIILKKRSNLRVP